MQIDTWLLGVGRNGRQRDVYLSQSIFASLLLSLSSQLSSKDHPSFGICPALNPAFLSTHHSRASCLRLFSLVLCILCRTPDRWKRCPCVCCQFSNRSACYACPSGCMQFSVWCPPQLFLLGRTLPFQQQLVSGFLASPATLQPTSSTSFAVLVCLALHGCVMRALCSVCTKPSIHSAPSISKETNLAAASVKCSSKIAEEMNQTLLTGFELSCCCCCCCQRLTSSLNCTFGKLDLSMLTCAS